MANPAAAKPQSNVRAAQALAKQKGLEKKAKTYKLDNGMLVEAPLPADFDPARDLGVVLAHAGRAERREGIARQAERRRNVSERAKIGVIEHDQRGARAARRWSAVAQRTRDPRTRPRPSSGPSRPSSSA